MRKSTSKLDDRYTRSLSVEQMELARKYDVSSVGVMLTILITVGAERIPSFHSALGHI